MAERGMLHNGLSAKQGTRSIRVSSSSARNGLSEESIPIKNVLLEFSSVIQENLKRDCPNLAIRFRENGNNVECILGGTTREVENAKSKLLSMESDLAEKKLWFTTNTCSALKSFSIENIMSNLLKNDYQQCVAKQVNNEIFLYGFDRNVIDKAAKYVSRNIAHKDFLLSGSLRENKEALVDHFKKVYQDKIVVYIDEVGRLNLLGQKDAVDEACCEYVDISEGRKRISPTNMLPQGKTKVTQKFGPLEPVYFRFFCKSFQLEQVVQCEKVKIFTDEMNCSFSVQGEKENVSRAIVYLNKISHSIRTNEINSSSSGPISIIRSSEDKSEFEKCLQKFDVLLEKKITYVCGRLHVTNRLYDNCSSIWLSSKGKQLTVKFSAFDDLRVDRKFVMIMWDPSKGGKYKCISDVLVEIAVPDKVSRGQTDDNTIGEIINTTLGKVASSRAKVVAFLISPFANWDFNSIMRHMVNSFVEWLMGSETAEGFSVILCVEKHADFVETDEYFGSRLWMKMKDRDVVQPEIRIVKGYLHKTVADVIVNTASPDLDLRHGKISEALLAAAGQGLQEECKKQFPGGIKPDTITVTGGYALNCKNVFHITLQRERSLKFFIESIRNAMMLCLRMASVYCYKSIAFPAMGTGSLKYPIKEVASEMVMAMKRFTKKYEKAVSIKEVQIVIHPKDSTLFETFQRMKEKLVTPATEVSVIFEITGNEKNVDRCQSWLRSEGRLTPNSELAQLPHEQGCVHSTLCQRPDKDTSRLTSKQWQDTALSKRSHWPGGEFFSNAHKRDTDNPLTNSRLYSAHSATSFWPGVAYSSTNEMSSDAYYATDHKPSDTSSITDKKDRAAYSVTNQRPGVAYSATDHRPCVAFLTTDYRPGAATDHKPSATCSTTDERPGIAYSATDHRPGIVHSATDHRAIVTCSTTDEIPGVLYSAKDQRPSVAYSVIDHKHDIAKLGTSKLIDQETTGYVAEVVKVNKVKNTARDRPKSAGLQRASVPTFFGFSYAYEIYKMLVCKFGIEGEIKVQVYCGDIINLQNIQAVVCSENIAGNAKGIVAKLLLKNGGEEYLQDKATKFSHMPAVGDIVTTSGGRNSYMWIIHAIMPRKEPSAIRKMYSKIFEEVAERRFTSVSLPLLGTSVGDVDPRTCTEMLLDELIQFCQTQRWQKLSLHIVSNDELVSDIVKDVFTKTIDEMNTIENPTKHGDDFVLNNITDESSDDGEI